MWGSQLWPQDIWLLRSIQNFNEKWNCRYIPGFPLDVSNPPFSWCLYGMSPCTGSVQMAPCLAGRRQSFFETRKRRRVFHPCLWRGSGLASNHLRLLTWLGVGSLVVSSFIIHCPKRVYCKSRESIPEIIFCTLAQQCVSICKHASVLTSHTKRDTCKPQPLVVSIISAGVSCDKFLTHPASAEGFLEEVVGSISGHTGISWPSWGSSAWKLWLAGCWKNVWVWSGSSLSCSTSLTYKYNGVPDNMLFNWAKGGERDKN